MLYKVNKGYRWDVPIHRPISKLIGIGGLIAFNPIRSSLQGGSGHIDPSVPSNAISERV